MQASYLLVYIQERVDIPIIAMNNSIDIHR